MQPLLTLLVLDERLRPRRLQAALAMFILILIAGSIPGARAEIGNLASGVILHSIAYAILTFLLYTGTGGSRTVRAIRAVLIVAAMGAVDECVQSMFPYRTAAIGDWAVDVTASLVCATLLWTFLPQAAQRTPS
jgi:VanZ family protein